MRLPWVLQGLGNLLFAGPAALVVSVLGEAVLSVVAEPRVNLALPAFGQFVPHCPHLRAVIVQGPLVLSFGVVRFVQNRVVLQGFLDSTELPEGFSDSVVLAVHADGVTVQVAHGPMGVMLGHHVGVIALGRRSEALGNLLMVALFEQASIPTGRVPNGPLVGVFQVVTAMPGEA
jgi:hypothetical protein